MNEEGECSMPVSGHFTRSLCSSFSELSPVKL